MDQGAAQTNPSSPRQSPSQSQSIPDAATISRIQALLESKQDTQRFVALALLKSVLDNSPQLRQDASVIQRLWASTSPKFLERLVRTGSRSSGQNAKEMLDLAISVLHTFAALLPQSSIAEPKFTDRIPGLVNAVLYCSNDSTTSLLQLLHTLVSIPEGAKSFIHVEDPSPLAEIAPSHALVLDIFRFAWLNGMAAVVEKHLLVNQITDTMRFLVSSFMGTDGVTLLDFLGSFLRDAHPDVDDDKPFAYLLVDIILIDIRSSTPTLLEQLNQPGYTELSQRLASALDVIAIFIGYLVRCLEDDSIDTFTLSPQSLLKLRKSISETMSGIAEYLRDRWDATFAGAMGLHPDARVASTDTATGLYRSLTWDSMTTVADEDPLILSAIRSLSLWLREDENEMLQKEATGLMDVFMELYRRSSSERLDFRPAVLVALEALITIPRGRKLFLQHDGWGVLSQDLGQVFQKSLGGDGDADADADADASRGVEIVRVLLTVAEEEASDTPEEWMDSVTAMARWDTPALVSSAKFQELQIAFLQLCCALLHGATSGMRSRHRHSIRTIQDVANQMTENTCKKDKALADALDEVRVSLDRFCGEPTAGSG
ncbi:hypothetical protein UVI_02047660 [Ustilaginoidea virens]|uniref:DUF1941 family protein n=1 Tax=Ustilaginoidea virens TaxID=1159556 RepID=A0A1B5LA02_USTVR|nr:hypothetical protein UVI_02047660 [Ustilaginoidea virens]